MNVEPGRLYRLTNCGTIFICSPVRKWREHTTTKFRVYRCSNKEYFNKEYSNEDIFVDLVMMEKHNMGAIEEITDPEEAFLELI